TPRRRGDFNVPTPMQVGDQLLVTTENNGARLFKFKADGVIDPEPLALSRLLPSDTHSPVVVGTRVFGAHHGMQCLDLKNGLKPIWTSDNDAFNSYCSIVATDERLLVVALDGTILLLDARADKLSELGRWQLF